MNLSFKMNDACILSQYQEMLEKGMVNTIFYEQQKMSRSPGKVYEKKAPLG